eukprot:2762557-Rhodomonas_salina.2
MQFLEIDFGARVHASASRRTFSTTSGWQRSPTMKCDCFLSVDVACMHVWLCGFVRGVCVMCVVCA